VVELFWKYNMGIGAWELLPEERGEEVEKVICAEFGCGNALNYAEQKFGDYCQSHSKDRKKKLTDIIERYL
jgi:hypothetical protein